MSTSHAAGSAQKKSKKDRDVLSGGQPLLSGVLYRGSHVVPDCVKRREAILFRDKMGTFGKGRSSTKAEKKQKQKLDKVWVFAAHHKLTPIKRRKVFAMENQKRHTLLSSLTSGHYVERELYIFCIKSEIRVGSSSKAVTEKVDLAFEDMSDAYRWRQAIHEQIAAIRRRERPSLDVGASQDLGTAGEDGEEGYAVSGVAEARAEHGNGASPMAAADPATPTVTANEGSCSEDDGRSLAERTSSIEALQRDLRLDSRAGPSLDDWKIVSSENGITVLRGTEQHNGNSIMLSYIIRAPPRLCVKTLLQRRHQSFQVDGFTLEMKLVESVDPFNDVLQTTWQPRGLEGFFMAPRKLCVRRLWRREDDGSYVVIFKACNDAAEEQDPPWWNWFSPVSCKLVDTCYTFSPLTSEYSRSGDSSETLVTQVSCYGDLGGWMSRDHPCKRILNILAPFSTTSWTGFIRPHVQSSVAIRNRAEADRFCVRPFLQSHDDGRAMSIHSMDESRAASIQTGYSIDEELPPEITPPPSLFANAAERPFRDPTLSLAGEALPSDSETTLSHDTISHNMMSNATSEDAVPLYQANGHASSSTIGQASVSINGHTSTPAGRPRRRLKPADVATCDRKYWSCPGANNLKVRGANYLKDRKKIPASEPVFSLAATDLLQVDKPTTHIARYLPSLRHSTSPFTFIMQIMFGSPSLSLTFSWASPGTLPKEADAGSLAGQQSAGLPLSSPAGSLTDEDFALDEGELLGRPFELTLARFLAGGTNDEEANQRRHGTVKLIPRISQGAWFVKQAVGTTPCLLGRKLAATYFRGPRYFEVDVDVSSSSVAANIVGLVQGMTKSLVVDMAIVLEGHSPEELPESLLGTVRCAHLDLNSAKLLNTATGEITEKPATGKAAKLVARQTEPPTGNISRLAAKCQASLNPLKSA